MPPSAVDNNDPGRTELEKLEAHGTWLKIESADNAALGTEILLHRDILHGRPSASIIIPSTPQYIQSGADERNLANFFTHLRMHSILQGQKMRAVVFMNVNGILAPDSKLHTETSESVIRISHHSVDKTIEEAVTETLGDEFLQALYGMIQKLPSNNNKRSMDRASFIMQIDGFKMQKNTHVVVTLDEDRLGTF